MLTQAMRKMIAARAALILDQPFWGMLALKLRLQEDTSCETAWVNGRTLGFNPEYVLNLPTHSNVKALFGHEVGHCALGHPWRRDGREQGKWNEATDRALNPMLRDAQFDLPDDVLYELDAEHHGKSAEWIYNRLPQPLPSDNGDGNGNGGEDTPQEDNTAPQQTEEEDGGGEDKPQPFGGEVRDAPTDTNDESGDVPPTEEEWKQAVQQAAAIAEGQGKLPGDAKRLVEKAVAPCIDWRSILRRFAQEVTRSDYSWAQPNRRYIAQGLYLPSLYSQEIGPFVLAIDVSGSIDNTLMSIFGGAFAEMMHELQPRRVHVMYCSAAIHGVDTFERGEAVEFNPRGGGGTSFVPVFEALEQLEEPPVCILYLTDLCGQFPESDNGVPTLWVTPQRYAQKAVPFGEIVPVEE